MICINSKELFSPLKCNAQNKNTKNIYRWWTKLGPHNGTITPLRKMKNLKHKAVGKQNKAFEMVPVPLSGRPNVAGW